jgi:hypothetical protein
MKMGSADHRSEDFPRRGKLSGGLAEDIACTDSIGNEGIRATGCKREGFSQVLVNGVA